MLTMIPIKVEGINLAYKRIENLYQLPVWLQTIVNFQTRDYHPQIWHMFIVKVVSALYAISTSERQLHIAKNRQQTQKK